MSTSERTLQLLDLPFEIIHKILFLLSESPVELSSCQLVNKHLNAIISESLILQYAIALASAKADDNPCSVVPLPQKLQDIRSSEAAWASLQPKFIVSLPVTHRTSSIYDLSGGTYLLGSVDRMSLQYLQLPTRVDDPLDWRKITVDKTIIDMGFCVFEHDLIAVFTSAPTSMQTGSLDIEMTLLEYSTGRPHPRANNSTIFIMRSSTRPTLLCEIMGDNLVLVLNFMDDIHGEDRIFIWNWRKNVLKTAFLVPYHTYSGILFLEEDLIILPNAKSAAFDFFRIPMKPSADSLKPIFSLKLPSLANGLEFYSITCRGEPNPISDISRLNKRQRAQERADVGMDEMDPFAPKRGFLASGEDAICLFQIRFGNTVIVIQGGINVQFEPTGGSYTLFVHRSSFLKLARQYEGANSCPLPENQVGEGVTLDPRQIAWVDWGPPVSRWFNSNGGPTRWITISAGQRCVMIQGDDGGYGTPITILDFNPFNIRKMRAKTNRERERAKRKFLRKLRSMARVPELVDWLASAGEEDRPPLSASELGNLFPSTEAAIRNHTHMEDENELSDMPDVTGDMDVGDSDDGESWVTDSDNSMPQSDEPHTPSAGYTTNPRHPGLADSRVVDDPSLESSGIFAEEVEGRLPYIEYVSERDYDYDGVLLDEERMLGITTDANDRILSIDVFYFG